MRKAQSFIVITLSVLVSSLTNVSYGFIPKTILWQGDSVQVASGQILFVPKTASIPTSVEALIDLKSGHIAAH